MHASIKHQQSAFETKVLAMENGFNNFPVPKAQLNVGKEVLSPDDIVQRFNGYITIINDVQATREAHQAAVKACEKAMPAAHAFYEEAVVVVKAHFGSDPKILATFGLGTSHKAGKRLPMVVIEEVIMPPRMEDTTGPVPVVSSTTEELADLEPPINRLAGAPRSERHHQKGGKPSLGPPRDKSGRGGSKAGPSRAHFEGRLVADPAEGEARTGPERSRGMSRDHHAGVFERRVRAMVAGFRLEFPPSEQRVLFGGRETTLAEVLAQLEAMVATFETVHQAERGYRQAVDHRRRSMKGHRSTYEDAVFFLKHHLGRASPRLVAFGVAPPKQRRPLTVQARAASRLKAAATRRARGTLGPKARLAVGRPAEPTLLVFGLDGSPVPAAAEDPSPEAGGEPRLLDGLHGRGQPTTAELAPAASGEGA